MRDLVSRYVPRSQPRRVLDIGSYDVNGSYKEVFDDPVWSYVGADLEQGPNVDVVLESPYRLPFASGSFDILVSGQAIEHMDFFWLSWLEMVRVVAPGGMIFLLAPSRGPEHRYPVDCWRFYPDGFEALARWGGTDVVEITTDWAPDADADSAVWGDTVGVFRVTKQPLSHRVARGVIAGLSRRLIAKPASGGHAGHDLAG